jgi:hypothetical protein
MLNRSLCASLAFLSSTLALAATHSDVTAYEDLKSRFELQSGQTYLAFVKNQIKPALDSYEQKIQNDPASKSKNYSKLQTDLIAQGAGVAIRIDSQNYIFNIGYLDGSDAQNDIKSGRSYGVGPSGTESDPSDLAYLKELESYLSSEPEASGDFIFALMSVLTDCDASGWSALSAQGQAVATDFLAIYTAELDRHLMVNLAPNRHPWETDLAAATFVSVFDVTTGLMMQNGSLAKGSIKDWWALGKQGSGIGETRSDRQALQALIAKKEASSKESQQIESLVKSAGGQIAGHDVIQGLLVFLSSTSTPEHFSASEVRTLSEGMKNYLSQVRADSNEIAQLQ